MEVETTPIPGALIIKPKVFADGRGKFLEAYHSGRYAQAGIEDSFVQDNHSRSKRAILRGLHFQINHPQGKLVYVTRGSIFDVIVDLRPDSSAFGTWHGLHLDDENNHQLWVPPGLAHGFCVTSEWADVIYKCTEFYRPEDEGSILWNDPELGIRWPVQDPLLSAKDSRADQFKDALARLQGGKPQ